MAQPGQIFFSISIANFSIFQKFDVFWSKMMLWDIPMTCQSECDETPGIVSVPRFFDAGFPDSSRTRSVFKI